MKKEKSPILVIFCIFLLSLFVILPPTFRSMFPKEDTNKDVTDVQQPKLVVVNCTTIYPNELYQVNSRTKYIEKASPTNTFTFTKLDMLPENYIPGEITMTTTAIDELTYLKNIPNIQYIENENITTITLDNTIIASMPEDKKIKNYLSKDYNTQKEFFESLGYTCNILES